jgi:hypothetical protein
MHPPLFRSHPLCQEVVDNLIRCHEENKIGKFFGACNQAKVELDKCFKIEKEQCRQENLAKARKFDAKFEAYMKAENSNQKS